MWERIKKILSKEGGKCIIIKEGEPDYIVMKLEDYEKSLPGLEGKEEKEIEKVNQDIEQWRAEENRELPGIEEGNQENEGVKIEDLPF